MADTYQQSIFNLIRERWLPVRRRSGAVICIAPWEITAGINEDPIVAFAWSRPDFDGAALEFMIGLLSTASAPDNNDEWADKWHHPPEPAELERALGAVAHAFDLDGPGFRFLQDAETLEAASVKDVSALLIDSPGAQTLRHNADLFVKRGGVNVLCRAAAAMALYTLSAYAPSGGAGHRTSLRGGGPLTTLVVATSISTGSTLWGRVWPNVETLEQIDHRNQCASSRADETIFPWLCATRTSESKSGRATTPSDVHASQVYWGMPRRIRLQFEDDGDSRCDLTGAHDRRVVRTYRTKNYGTNYSEGFTHPLTPYYRQTAGAVTRLAVHPHQGAMVYRHWPGVVAQGNGGLRDPAQTVRSWHERQRKLPPNSCRMHLTMFGYDMDNMKACAWLEGEAPILAMNNEESLEHLRHYLRVAAAGAEIVGKMVIGAVKAALYDRPKDAPGNYGYISERLFRETEPGFRSSLEDAMDAIDTHAGDDDPTLSVREAWLPVLRQAALRLFEEYAPSDGLEDRNMHRHVKAYFFLTVSLLGRGKGGQNLFATLEMPLPESSGAQGDAK